MIAINRIDGLLWKSVQPLDSSFIEESIQNGKRLQLEFVLTAHEEVPELCSVAFEGSTYILFKSAEIEKVSTREYRYRLTLEGEEGELALPLIKHVSGKTQFSYTGTPHEFAQLLAESTDGWKAGTSIEADPKLVTFKDNSVLEACNMVAKAFETEVRLSNKTIAFGKIQSFENDPLELSYKNGLASPVKVSPDGDEVPIGRLYVHGGERNIDREKYGFPTLHLPQGESLVYKGNTYRVSDDRRYIYLEGDSRLHTAEKPFDATSVYPMHEGSVTAVEVTEKGDYDILDSANTIDYSQYRVGGETMVVTFQSGRLAGRSFAVATKDDKLVGYVHSEGRFMLVREEMDGVMMPEAETFYPSVGDKYAVFGITLPQEYITQAEQEMFRKGVEYMAERLSTRRRFTSELDGIWAKSKWNEVAHKLVIGASVRLSDPDLGTPEAVRISGIRREVNSPYTPRLTFTNAPFLVGSLTSRLASIEAQEVQIKETSQAVQKLESRTYKDSEATKAMIEKLQLEGFSEAIKPEALQSVQAVFAIPELQFDFVRGVSDLTTIPFRYTKDFETYTFPTQYLRTKEQGTTLSPEETSKVYTIPRLVYTFKEEQTQAYLYAVLDDAGSNFLVSEEALPINAKNKLVALIHGVGEGRKLTTLYGFTEILPSQIRTDLITSKDGKTYWNLLTGEQRNKGNFYLGPDGNTKLAFITDPITGEGTLYIKGATIEVDEDGTTIEDAIADQQAKLDAINANPPRINANGNWEVYTFVDGAGAYKDTGRSSVGDDGKAPKIVDGYWYEWNGTEYTNTGVKAIGVDGAKGDKGDKGDRGDKGDKGNKGDKGADGKDGKDAVNFSAGKMLFKDPTFKEGLNGMATYNRGGTAVTLRRVEAPEDCPTSSGWVVRYAHDGVGGSGPALGGFVQYTLSRPNAVFVHRFIAKVPVGYYLQYAFNQTGDGRSFEWLTDTKGTGKFQEYAYIHRCGVGGTFSTLGYAYFGGGRGPLEVDIAYATVYDMTDATEVYELIGDAKRATDDLKAYTDGAFKDGVISEVEAKDIAGYINTVNEAWQSAFAEYEKVYTNSLLTGTPKTTLLNTKTTLAGAKEQLINAINSTIADGKATASEQRNVNAKYDAFNNSLQAFKKALEVARETIRQAGIDGVQIGGRNLLKPISTLGNSDNKHRKVVVDGNALLWTQLSGSTSPYRIKLHSPISDGTYTLSYKCSVGDKYRSYIYYTRLDNGDDWSSKYSTTTTTTTELGDGSWLHTITFKELKASKNREFNFYGTDPFDPPKEVRFWDFKFEKGSVATDWTEAPEDVEARYQEEIERAKEEAREAQRSANSANTAVGNLNSYVDGAFKDGIISEAEAKAIEKYINVVESEKGGLEATYNKLYTNEYLVGTPKTNLLNAKITYFGKTDELISTIRSAIADGKTTVAEKQSVDTKYAEYKDAHKSLQSAIEEANKAIQKRIDELSSERVDNIQVGGRNLLRGTAWEGLIATDTEFWANSVKVYYDDIYPYVIEKYNWALKHIGLQLTAGTYTLSFYCKSHIAGTHGLPRCSSTLFDYLSPTLSTDDWVLHTHTFSVDTDTEFSFFLLENGNTNALLRFAQVKLERGNKATDWTEAPEDVEARYQEEIERAKEEARAENAKALEAARKAHEEALGNVRHAFVYGEYDPTLEYPFTELETAIVLYKGRPYILTGKHTKGIAPDTPEGKKIWKQMSSSQRLYARYIQAERATIGDMVLVNGERDDDYLAFEHHFDGPDKPLDRYMQIGGSLPSEAEIIKEGTIYGMVDLLDGKPRTEIKDGTYWLDIFNSAEDNRRIDYEVEGSITARAGYEPVMIPGGGRILKGETSKITAYMRVVVEDTSGREVYRYNSTKTSVVAQTTTILDAEAGKLIPPADFKRKDINLAFTIPAEKVSRYYKVETYLVVEGYGNINCTLTKVHQKLPYATRKSFVGITKDRVLMFFNRTRYVLFNYLSEWVMKVVGNLLVQGNVHVTGSLTANQVKSESGGLLCAGVINTDGNMNRWVGTKLITRKIGTGRYRITHNVGSTNYAVVVTSLSPSDYNAFVVEGTETNYSVEVGVQWNSSWQNYAVHFAIFSK